MGANRPTAPFPVHPEVVAAKQALFSAFNTGIDIGKAREHLACMLEVHQPRESRHPDQLEATTLRDAFERRRMVRNRFLGPVSANQGSGTPYQNYCNLLSDGWTVKIFLNDVEQPDAIGADPDKGEVYRLGSGWVPVTFKGVVEIRMERAC